MLTLAAPDPEETAIVVSGYVDIQAKLVNNAEVGVKYDDDVMTLSEYTKSGSGDWFCLGGKLQVDAGVTGSGDWTVDGSSAIVEINAACTPLSGDIVIDDGLLDVNENFCTSGNLTFEGTGSQIDVAAQTGAGFATNCQ